MKKYNTVNQKPITHEEAEQYVNLIESGMKGHEAVAIIRPDCKWPKDIAYAWSKTNKKVQAAFNKRYTYNEVETGKRVGVFVNDTLGWVMGDVISNHKGLTHVYVDSISQVISVKSKDLICKDADTCLELVMQPTVEYVCYYLTTNEHSTLGRATGELIIAFKRALRDIYGDELELPK